MCPLLKSQLYFAKINKCPYWNKRPPWHFARKLIIVHPLVRASIPKIFSESTTSLSITAAKSLGFFLFKRLALLNTVSCIAPNMFDFNNEQLTGTLLHGKEDLDNISNTSILDATINYLIETKRFNVELFLCSPDAMALTLL